MKRRRPAYRPYGGRRKRRWPWVALCLLLAAVLAFAALEVTIVAHSRTRITGEPEVMVIFGCQVKPEGPSILLRDRLDTALAYLEDHPDMKIVVAGGKGDDEHISEAQCMYDYLTAHGVDGESIYLEDQSRSTWENIRYTLDLLAAEGYDTTSDLLAVSSGFHLSRIQMLYDRAYSKDYLSTLAAPVTHWPSKVQMFFREPLALVKSFIFDR